jgi:hypothetical protein
LASFRLGERGRNAIGSIFIAESRIRGMSLGWCLLQLAWHQQITAALLLPLYYLGDATLTLLRRVARGEPFWTGHRSHF